VSFGIKFVYNCYCFYNSIFLERELSFCFSKVFIIDCRKRCILIRDILILFLQFYPSIKRMSFCFLKYLLQIVEIYAF
jgi:hypothetical protein